MRLLLAVVAALFVWTVAVVVVWVRLLASRRAPRVAPVPVRAYRASLGSFGFSYRCSRMVRGRRPSRVTSWPTGGGRRTTRLGGSRSAAVRPTLLAPRGS